MVAVEIIFHHRSTRHNFGGRGGARKPPVLDIVYVVNDSPCMSTVVQSCRIEEDHAALLSRQAKRRHLEVSTLSSLYLKEKALEEEFPGIGFRDLVLSKGDTRPQMDQFRDFAGREPDIAPLLKRRGLVQSGE